MTLNLEKFISNSIKTQAKIQHLDIFTKTVKNIPESVKSIIVKDYGDKYLLDADYVSFFWGAIDKDTIKKLFNVVDKALGKSANKLTETDFKKISIKSSDDDIEEEQDEDDIEDRDEEVESDADEDIKDKEDESLDEDDESDEEQVEDEPKAQMKTSHFFLKITLK